MVRLSCAAAADDNDDDDDDDDDDHYCCIITTVSFFLESLLYVFISNDYIRLYSDGWGPPAVARRQLFFIARIARWRTAWGFYAESFGSTKPASVVLNGLGP